MEGGCIWNTLLLPCGRMNVPVVQRNTESVMVLVCDLLESALEFGESLSKRSCWHQLSDNYVVLYYLVFKRHQPSIYTRCANSFFCIFYFLCMHACLRTVVFMILVCETIVS